MPRSSIITLFIICLLGFFFWSCIERKFTGGEAELVSVSDSTLNNLSVFMGKVNDGNSEIWVLELGDSSKVKSDSKGYYVLNVPSGFYTLRCQVIGNKWKQLVVEYKYQMEPNKKVIINFQLGETYFVK